MSSSESEYTSDADSRVGTILKERYRLDSVLGIGGMAIVYTATHRNQRRFAVKILRPELSVRTDMRTRFIREGYIANSVGHPGAVAVLDDDVASDGAAFLVMELLEGAGLEQVWERHGGKIPVRAALAVGWQLLDVLAAAHAKAIVHRDIKPANLFVTRDGTLKVLDFGIARLRDAASEHATQSGTAMGTPAFMPPEQVLGKSSQIDALTDIWAVGATLFTLVSGQLVHEGETPQELMIRSATVAPRSLGVVSRDLPPAAVAIVDRALQFDRSGRWPSASAMRDAIAAVYRSTFGESISVSPLVSLLAAREGAAAPTVVADTPAGGGLDAVGPTLAAARDLAATIGQSSAVDAPSIAPTVDNAARGRTVEAAPIAHLIGMTTSQPVSNEMAPVMPATGSVARASGFAAAAQAGSRKPIGAIAAAVAALLAVGIMTAVLGRPGTVDTPRRETASARPAAADVSPLPPAATAPAPVPLVASAMAAQPSSSVARVEVAASSPRRGAQAARPSPGGARTAVAAPGLPAGAAAEGPSPVAKPNCDPNYTIDIAGHRILKRECL
jgi:tRNA A-37 threonylcarbamoyl transferase component Bud32